MSRRSTALVANIVCAAMLLATPALAAHYEGELDPAPFDATTRPILLGSIGTVSATLTGNMLAIHGAFSNLTSNATGGSVRIGLAKGVPGEAIGTLIVTHGQDGDFSGMVKLSAAQLAALKRQALYVRIDSEKAPDGNLQGWLEETGN
jgi:hypothetical protein